MPLSPSSLPKPVLFCTLVENELFGDGNFTTWQKKSGLRRASAIKIDGLSSQPKQKFFSATAKVFPIRPLEL